MKRQALYIWEELNFVRVVSESDADSLSHLFLRGTSDEFLLKLVLSGFE